MSSTQHQESSRILLMLEYWAMPRHLGKITQIAMGTEQKQRSKPTSMCKANQQGPTKQGILGRLAVWSRSALLIFRTRPSFCYFFLLQSLISPSTFMCTFRRKGTSHAHILRSQWVSTQYLTLLVKYSRRLALAPISFFLSFLSQS